MACDKCKKEYPLKGGMKALIESFDDYTEDTLYLCTNCHSID